MTDDRQLYLRKLLIEKYVRMGRSYNSLEAHMTKQNHGKKILNRIKLQELCEGVKDVSLRISELKALDDYLSPQFSLCKQPFFYREGDFLDSFSEESNLSIYVGTRYSRELRTETVSGWDLRAFRNLLRSPELSHLHVEIEDVVNRADLARVQKDIWMSGIKKDRYSVFSFGSPFVNHATEVLLANMLGVTSFKKPVISQGSDSNNLLPFYLIWPRSEERQNIEDCAFLMDMGVAKRLYKEKAADMLNAHRAIVLADNVYISERMGDNYGLLVAQRQAGPLYCRARRLPDRRIRSMVSVV